MSYRMMNISEKVPNHIRELLIFLEGETSRLREQWQMFEALYDYSEERLKLLQKSAPDFFSMVYFLFVDNFILSLCRLGDPAKTYVKGVGQVDNLSLKQLFSRLDRDMHVDLIRKLEPLLSDFREKSQNLKIHRNTRIGHLGLKETMEEGKNPYPEISLEAIEETLVAAEDFLHKTEGHFSGDESRVIANTIVTEGATPLLDKLHKAVAYEKCEEAELIERGTARKLADPKA
jgi:hypothetical protein